MSTEDQLRVLVVDDEPDVAEVVSSHLGFHDLHVEVCHEGARVHERVCDDEIDLVLLDLVMPDRSGWEVLDELRRDEKTRHVPVIILSALVDTNDIVRGLEAGANDYVLKPADYDELAARIRRHVSLQQRLRELVDGKASVVPPAPGSGDASSPSPSAGGELAEFLGRLEDPLQHLCLAVSMAQLNCPDTVKGSLEPVARIVRELQELVLDTAASED